MEQDVRTGGSERDATPWDVSALIDHIESVHHAYVRAASPRIAQHLAALVAADGEQHPELLRVAACFDQMRSNLAHHMVKEERILFPYVRDLAERGDSCGVTSSPFGSVANPIRMMEREHEQAASALQLIRELTRGYATPADVCDAFGAVMSELRAFEADLDRHVRLEHDVLFPAAVRLEAMACPAVTSDGRSIARR